MTRRGRVFTPAKTLEAESIIKEKWDGPCYEGPVSLSCKFNKESITVHVAPIERAVSPLRGDLDNYVKLLMDGLNGVAWLDDKQVYVIDAEKS